MSVSLIDDILEKYPNDVKVVIKNCPLKIHKDAMLLAQYSLAANEQGKYIEMYKYLMSNQALVKTDLDLVFDYAKEIELDIQKLKKDAASERILNQIILESQQLIESNIRSKGVPKFLIQGKELFVFNAGKSIEDFSKIIEKELKKTK
tara:strand:+ start:263 stop:706 length:444 start_codon:yes stop_codon:yes gene_type:complete